MDNGSNSQFVPIIGKKKCGHEWIVGIVSPENGPVGSLGRGKARILSRKSSFLQGLIKTSHSKKSRLSVDRVSVKYLECALG